MAETIGARMERIPHPHGFDYVRIALAWGVLFFHSFSLSGVAGPPLPGVQGLILPMFFALGGFLVAGSYLRSRTLAGFLTLRALRLTPALAFEVLLSALILGPIVTNVPLADYFAAPEFRAYFLNILGYPHYYLPGVFTANPVTQVNGQLWTLPWDLMAYAIAALVAIIGVGKRPRVMLALLLAVIAIRMAMLFVPATRMMWHYGAQLVVAFFAGFILYMFRDHVRRSAPLMIVCLVATFLLNGRPLTGNLAMLPLAYVTIWLGQLDLPRTPLAGTSDYSYGVFLFAFPVQQWVQTMPMFQTWYWNVAVSTPLAFLCAAASWHLVEQPVLNRKYRAVAAVEAGLGRFAGLLRGTTTRWRLTRPPPPSQ